MDNNLKIHPTALLIKNNTQVDPHQDFIFEGKKICLSENVESKYKNSIKDLYRTQIKNIVNYSCNSLVAVNEVKSTELTKSRVRAILWRAEALEKTSDKPCVLIVNRYDEFYRAFLRYPEVWQDAGYARISSELTSDIQKRLKQYALLDDDKYILHKAATALQSLEINKVNLIRGYNKDGLHEIISTLDSIYNPGKTEKSRLFFVLTMYKICITAMNNMVMCGELISYAIYHNYIAPSLKKNTVAIQCKIKFNDYTFLLNQTTKSIDHAFICLIDKNELIKLNIKGIESKYNVTLENRLNLYIPDATLKEIEIFNSTVVFTEKQNNNPVLNTCSKKNISIDTQTSTNKKPNLISEADKTALFPPMLRNVTAVYADPWIKKSGVITENSWFTYVHDIAKECGLQSFKGIYIIFHPV